jgi:hypothetical protein
MIGYYACSPTSLRARKLEAEGDSLALDDACDTGVSSPHEDNLPEQASLAVQHLIGRDSVRHIILSSASHTELMLGDQLAETSSLRT